jgi:uncharacterized membrane protein YphA (DoxX/SURF4 family)
LILSQINMQKIGTGKALYGISAACLATLSLVYGNFRPLLGGDFPVLLPRPEVWAYGSAAILLVASACIFFASTAKAGAIMIGAFELVWVATGARPLFHGPVNVGSMYGFFEALSTLVGAWLLYALLRRQSEPPTVTAMTGGRALLVARILFGAACILFGAAHFVYAAYTVAFVPAWLPGRMNLVYITGACHAAAGLGIIIGVLPRFAATMEGILMSLFGVLVWLPTFFEQPRPAWATPAQVQCSETFLTFLIAASAFIVAESLRRNLASSRQRYPAE